MNTPEYQIIPMNSHNESERILSIYLTYRGFGFVVFEDPETVLDWGHSSVEGQDYEIFKKRITSITRYSNIETVLSFSAKDRPAHIQKNIHALKGICKKENIDCFILPKDEINTVFGLFGSFTKYQKAGLVASYLPDLAYKLPPKRKPWQSEDLRMSIFDAACLALTYFYKKQ